MTRVLAAELLKLRTTRTAAGFLLTALGLTTAFLLIGILVGTQRTSEDSLDAIHIGLAPLIALVAAIVGVTGEYRHGTIASTFLAVPVRRRQLAGQALAYALAAAALALACWALELALGLPLLAGHGSPAPDAGDLAAMATREVPASALLAALGIGFGATVRHQPGALVGALLALLFAEPTVYALIDGTYDYGPLGSADALIGTAGSDAPSALTGGLVLAAWAAAALGAGLLATERRDI